MSAWLYKGEEITSPPEGAYGFVYQITNLINGMKYIGKKFFLKPHYRQVKGKRKKSMVESDWQTYYGSSQRLVDDIKKYGKENFKREILLIENTRGMVNYMEAKTQFLLEVLESDDYYNGIIQIKIGGRSVKRKE
jgi:hypothetical protein